MLMGLDLNVKGYEHGYQFFQCGLSEIASLIYTNVTQKKKKIPLQRMHYEESYKDMF